MRIRIEPAVDGGR